MVFWGYMLFFLGCGIFFGMVFLDDKFQVLVPPCLILGGTLGIIGYVLLWIYDTPPQTSETVATETEQDKESPPKSVDCPTSEAVATKIKQYETSLSKTVDLLNKREKECDEAQQKFFDECASFKKSVIDAATELQKSDSKQKTEPWFEQVQFYWLDWKDIERDVVIFSRQKKRLEKTLRKMGLLLKKLIRKEENDTTYIPGEDKELDDMIASTKVDLELDDFSKNLSSAEKTEIDVEVSNKMQEAIKNSNTD